MSVPDTIPPPSPSCIVFPEDEVFLDPAFQNPNQHLFSLCIGGQFEEVCRVAQIVLENANVDIAEDRARIYLCWSFALHRQAENTLQDPRSGALLHATASIRKAQEGLALQCARETRIFLEGSRAIALVYQLEAFNAKRLYTGALSCIEEAKAAALKNAVEDDKQIKVPALINLAKVFIGKMIALNGLGRTAEASEASREALRYVEDGISLCDARTDQNLIAALEECKAQIPAPSLTLRE